MKTVLAFFGALGVVGSATSHATAITFSGVPEARTVVGADGVTPVTSGRVWVGSFANTNFTFNSALSIADNVIAISQAGNWHQFGLDTVTGIQNANVTDTLTFSASSKVLGTVIDNNSGPTKATFFDNLPLYLWVFNGSSPAGSSQMGIFRSTDATPAWNFPQNANGLNDNPTLSTTPTSAPTVNAIGGTGSSTAAPLPGTLQLVASNVPEPSVVILLGLGALGFGASRRSRKVG